MARLDGTPASESVLCTACGLCCDGTLFGAIPLQNADFALAADRRATIVDRKGRPAAAQPCGFLDGFACTVYPDRYHACRQFRCKLLDAQAAGRIGHDAAREHIASARRLRDAVLAAAAAAGVAGGMPAIRTTVREWRRRRTLPLAAAMATLDLRLVALERHLARHFADQRQPSPLASATG